MLQSDSPGLSDLIKRSDGTIIDSSDSSCTKAEDNDLVKEYGVGIDCHSRFIEICVRYRHDGVIAHSFATFSTDWDSLVTAHDWCIEVLCSKASPSPDLTTVPFHYLMESTANYHMPVYMAWGGDSTIINPTIAGATKRKTDVLDAKLLALHDQLGIWREWVLLFILVTHLITPVFHHNSQ